MNTDCGVWIPGSPLHGAPELTVYCDLGSVALVQHQRFDQSGSGTMVTALVASAFG